MTRVFAELLAGWAPQGAAQTGDVTVRPADPAGAVGSDAWLPLDAPDVTGFVARCAAARITPWVEVGDVPRLREAAAAGAQLWLRGQEAAGRCGEVGSVVLIRAAQQSGRPWVASGLGMRAMAAAVALGAAGIVLDVHLWPLEGSPLATPEGVDPRFEGRSARDTQLQDGRRTLHGLPCSTAIGSPGWEHAVGTLSEAAVRFRSAVEAHAERMRSTRVLTADPFGTGRPIVQGPMANVAERPELGRAVLEAGGLPFCALGALRPDAARAVLDGMASLEGPWGAGVIGFDVMPHRDAHLQAVSSFGATVDGSARPVILAGGSPALASELVAKGLEPWLHTPSARLAKMALKRGVPAVVFEGREAGGHVGQLTSAACWEEGLAVLEAHETPSLVVLAGGIGDATSAAFAAAMATDAHSRGHRVGLQIGTALFFTHEIVEARQITRAYQQAALSADRTVYVGDTVNLPLQCAPNRYTDQAVTSEHRWATDGLPLRERRERVEHHNLGRTRIAAKGIERDGDGGYATVPAQRQLDEGAFTMGQGALVADRLVTVQELFDTLTHEAMALLARDTAPADSRWGPVETVSGAPSPSVWTPSRSSIEHPRDDAPIAVVGLGCVLPGAPDVPSYWQSLLYGMDAVRAIPDDRWRADRYFDPRGNEAGSGFTRTGVRMGGVVTDFTFDPLQFGIPPRVVASMDRAQQLALVAARQAIEGVRRVDSRRTAVVLGNSMGGEHAKSLAVRVRFREVLAALDADGAFEDLDPDGLAALSDRVEARLSEALPPVDVESMSGLLANVIAGRVAAWLDVMGGNTTVDAACAASLAAVETAVSWLRSGRSDLVLTGGVDADLSPETYVGFSRTYALSSTGSSPFSANADGFVMGEGAAMFALKRLDDAERDGDRVWAVIRGIGQSSDGRSSGITAPRAEGQQLAIQRAYQQAGFGPDTVELVEAHGTGTSVGDRTELTALSRVFAGQQAWLGSVKSAIGHLKGGAGAAGLLKAVLAVAHRTVPPTLHATPLADGLARSPFSLPQTPVPFRETADRAPRASVSAFGFGGTNFHVLLEGGDAVSPDLLAVPPPHVPAGAWSSSDAVPELRVYAADDLEGLLERLDADATCTPEEAAERTERLVVLDRPAGLRAWVATGSIGAFGTRAWRGSGPCPSAVWVYPGQGSPRDGALDGLHTLVPSARLYHQLGITDVDTSTDPAAQHALLVTAGIGWSAVLHAAGLGCSGVVGHSVGELAALVGAGRLEPGSALSLAHARGRGLMGCPPGEMLAVALDATAARNFAAEVELHVAAYNGPEASVLAGSSVARAAELARERGIRCTVLDVERAFHTPSVQPAADALGEVVPGVELAPGAPWWSNVGPVDDTAPAMREALVRAVVSPVGFVGSIERALEAGERFFVHIGPGRAMARHIEQIAASHRIAVSVVSLDPEPGEQRGIVQGAAALLAQGHVGLLRSLPARLVTLPFPTEPRAPIRAVQTELSAHHLPSRPASTGPSPTSDVNAPPQPPEDGGSGVRGVVLAAIFDVTGYPPEALVSGARLDADLGIDSIRKMEIVGVVQDQLELEIDDAALGEIGALDVDGLVAWLEEQLDTAAAGRPPSPSPSSASSSPSETHDRPGRWSLHRVPVGPPHGSTMHDETPSLADAIDPFLDPPTELPDSISLDLSNPVHHGLAAYLRVAAREAGTPIDIRFSDGTALRAPGFGAVIPTDDGPALPDAPVVLASGGTTGILAACLTELRRRHPGARGIVFGRRPDQEPPAGFTYARCDVTDADAVARLAERCRAEHGRIDLVVHAAGVLRDGLLDSLDAEARRSDLQAVLSVKLDGAANLIAATCDDAPIWVPFSSVSAHLPNPGQAFYAAANAALEQLVHPTAARSVPMVWTAWSEVGMASDPALQRLLASRGIRSLSPDEGAALFCEALEHDGPQWLAAGPPPTPPFETLPWPLSGWDGRTSGTSRFTLAFDPDEPVLSDHRVAGRPLVPAAVWVSALMAAAAVRGCEHPTVADLDIQAPCFVGRPEVVHLTLDAVESGIQATVRRGETVLCTARITSTPSDTPAVTGLSGAPAPTEPAQPLYRADLLFHGPAWQMLTGLGPFDDDGVVADVHINGTDPVATTIDGAHQLLATWSGRKTGWLGLPVGAAAWRVHRRPRSGAVRLSLRARVEEGVVTGDVAAVDPEGNLLLTGSGLRLRQASKWVDPE